MELKGSLSSTKTLLVSILCVALAGLLVMRLVWTSDRGRVEVQEQSELSSYSEEERKGAEESEHQDYSDGVSRMFDYNSDTLTGDCELGTCPTTGALSCHELEELGQPPGYYWVKTDNDSIVHVFCKMAMGSCDVKGRWTRAVLLNMSDPTHNCPRQWREITSPRRTCGRVNQEGDPNGAGCSSALFSTSGNEYQHVCGRVVGYQFCNTLAFWSYFHNEEDMTIDEPFVDGVTISHGSPREHIWTFAAALYKNYDGRDAICQCTKRNYDNKSYRRVRVPPWVGTSYFCETGTASQPPTTTEGCSRVYESVFYSENPLWDGEGCGETSSCCKFHRPPWFCTELPQPTTDDIEVRICGSSYTSFGDTPVELVELYIN